MRLFLIFLTCAVILEIPLYGQVSTIYKTFIWEQKQEKVLYFAFTPDGSYVVLLKKLNWNLLDLESNSNNTGDIDVIETTTGKILSSLKVCDGKFGFSPDSAISRTNFLAVSCRKGTAEIWDLKDGKLIQSINPTVAKEIDRYILSPDGKKIITFESGGWRTSRRAVLSDVVSGETLRILTPKLGGDFATNAAFSPDGKMVSVSYDGFVYLWKAADGELIHKLIDESIKGFPGCSHLPSSSVYVMLFTHDGKKLLTTSTDKFAKIWNTDTGELEHVIMGHKSRIDMGVLSEDGKIAAIIGDNKQIEFLAMETGKLLQKLKTKSRPHIEFTFSPDNTYFYSPTESGSSIWSVSSGKEVWNENSERAALSTSWKWLLSYDKKHKKLEMYELRRAQ